MKLTSIHKVIIMILKKEIENIKNQIIEKYNPNDIYLFDSNAKGVVRKNSDIVIYVLLWIRIIKGNCYKKCYTS